MRVKELMAKCPATCEPDDSLLKAAQTMSGGNCGCLPVTAGGGSQRLVGMIADRDIYTAALFQGRIDEEALSEFQVKDAMATRVRACHPSDDVAEVELIMREERVPLLPVVDEWQQVIGVIFLADITREAAPTASRDPGQLWAHPGGFPV